MNFSLIDKLIHSRGGILATIISTDGHTYKKTGAKAFFEAGEVTPCHGNLGALCADQEIVRRGAEVLASGKPLRVTIDLSKETDIHFGHGTYCGGSMELLIEPVGEPQRGVYRQLRDHLKTGASCRLAHDVQTGDIAIAKIDTVGSQTTFVEDIPGLTPLFIFGATPLARAIVTQVAEMDFMLHVIDWRSYYLDFFRNLNYVTVRESVSEFDRNSMTLILSHSFERDLEMLSLALRGRCRYIGLLSSKKRRDKMFDELENKGISRADTGRIHSPVGMDIGSRTDPEIAVSIVAELIKWKNAS